ncbi:tudor domain-containing protein [Mesorhizobium sp. M0494]|uniref:tudor domain-containing protein n=1 Tax=Mesorhizobium sp. M0494 TaxID=2956951 RepID=UPI0033388284
MTQLASSIGAPAAALPALIVLGLDDGGKAHASWFGEAEVGMAEKAAGMMGMAALPVADASDLRGLTDKLPHGRVFESGRAFVPFVKRTIYDAIATHLPPGYRFPARAAIDRPPPGKSKKASGTGAPESGPKRPEPSRPTDWTKIEVGSLVLATEGAYQGWYEAQVVKISTEGLYTLRWRDWLDMPVFTRKLIHIALLHPEHTD